GIGGFGPADTFPAGGFPHAPVAGNFDAGNELDLAVANDPNKISILLNDGNGGFGAPTSFVVGDSPRSIGIGDFNGDHHLDLAVVNGLSDNVSILLGD